MDTVASGTSESEQSMVTMDLGSLGSDVLKQSMVSIDLRVTDDEF